ncbi:MAG: tetratricopeptide repeat protein [Betaproteobacteria bacterium]|nr:tetratricopeptide repeat protein [Betaproteobacteria bacterium]
MTHDFETAKEHFVDGVAAFEAGRYADAERDFLASLALVPARVSTLANLAATRIKLSRPEEALALLEQAIAVDPENVDAWCHRGEALADLGRHDEALACFDRVVRAAGHPALAWYHRASALAALQRPCEVLADLDRFLAARPDHADAWFRHGQALQSLDRHEQALASYAQALALDPELAPAWSSRGSILTDLRRTDEAAHAFERALACGGDPALNGYFLAAVTGGPAPAVAPPQYVQSLFDDYAGSFDEHLTKVLRYRAPAVLIDNLRALGNRRFRRALDLGCGTGQCGPLVKAIAELVDGVDLSAQMLGQARALGVYERLEQAEIAAYLRAADLRYDLVLAADVFIYVGDLEPVFAGVRRVLDPGGVFCFSAELAGSGGDFELKLTLRYGQSERYLRALAQQHGFAVERVLRQPIREDRQQPVAGLYVYLTAA